MSEFANGKDEVREIAVQKHKAASEEATRWAVEARRWKTVIETLDGIVHQPGQRQPRVSKIRELERLCEEYLVAHGSARTARVLEDWLDSQGLRLTPGKLRKYLWQLRDKFAYDEAKGGWHLTDSRPEAIQTLESEEDVMKGIVYE